MIGQHLCGGAAGPGQIAADPVIHVIGQMGNDTVDVLVGQHAEDCVGGRVIGHVAQIGHQMAGGMRVVPHVQDDGGLPRQHLEASRHLDQRQAAADVLGTDRQLATHGLQRSQHAGGVEQLVHPAQCRIGQAAAPRAPPCPGPLLAVACIVVVTPQQPQVGTDLLGVTHQALRRLRIAADGGPVRPEDVGLFQRDGLAIIAQPLCMVDGHAGDDGAVRIHEVDGIQPPAQADLHHHRIQRLAREGQEHHQRGELEVRQRHIAARQLHLLEERQQRLVGQFLAIDADALVEAQQVRRGVQPHPVAGRAQDGIQHGAGGALAVGAGHHELHAR